MLVYCIYTAEDIVKLLSRPGTPITLVFYPSAGTQFQGEPLQRGRKIHEGGKSLRFLTEIAIYLGNNESHKFFPSCIYFAPPLTGFPWNWVSGKRVKKLVMGLCPSWCQQTNYEIVSVICSGPMSNHWFSHSTVFCLTATHATAVDAYLFWRRCSTWRYLNAPLGHKGSENVAARNENRSATV